jgi:RimJ/RimL family protein N-acetyltransferase
MSAEETSGLSRLPEAFPVRDDMWGGDIVTARRLTEADALPMYGIIARNPDIKRYFTWPHDVESPEETAAEIARYADGSVAVQYGLVTEENMIGYVSAYHDKDRNGVTDTRNVGIGYFLDGSSRRQGIITSAARAMTLLVETNLKPDSVYLDIAEGNDASLGVADKLGYLATGRATFNETLGLYEFRFERLRQDWQGILRRSSRRDNVERLGALRAQHARLHERQSATKDLLTRLKAERVRRASLRSDADEV